MLRWFLKRQHSFEELREWALKRVGACDQFQLFDIGRHIGADFHGFWFEINSEEYNRGYVHEEYIKDNTPALWQMKLLTSFELFIWKQKFKALEKPKSQNRTACLLAA